MKCCTTMIALMVSIWLCHGQQRLKQIKIRIQHLYQLRSTIAYYEPGAAYQQRKIDDKIHLLEVERYNLNEKLETFTEQGSARTQSNLLFDFQNALAFLYENKDKFSIEEFKKIEEEIHQARRCLIANNSSPAIELYRTGSITD